MAEAQCKTFNIVSWQADGSAATLKCFILTAAGLLSGGLPPPKCRERLVRFVAHSRSPARSSGGVYLQAVPSSPLLSATGKRCRCLQCPLLTRSPRAVLAVKQSGGLVQIHPCDVLRFCWIDYSAMSPQPTLWVWLVRLFLTTTTLYKSIYFN